MQTKAGPAIRLAAVMGCLVLGAAAHADNLVGAWLSPVEDNWPLVPIHAALTPDGRVLTYGTDGTGRQTGFFTYDVWDPAQGLSGGHVTLDNFTATDLFCSTQIILPLSGSILIAGGDNWTGTGTTNTGNNNSNIFKYSDDTLTRGGDMNRARWYGSSTVLPTGEIYIQGGTGGHDRPEIRDLSGGFQLLSGADTSGLSPLFPRNYLAPDGRVFGHDAAGQMYYVDTGGTGSVMFAGFGIPNVGDAGSSAMFRPGRILSIGGGTRSVVVIDITGGQPIVTSTQPLSSIRQWVSATVLADGRVLATGGSAVHNELTGVNNAAEIWDPATGQWTVGPSGSRARLYHSTALLLPDASVLVAGGGAPGPLLNRHAEIYYPPYLFDGEGELANRPVIVDAPDSVDVGQTVAVSVGEADIRKVTLVKTGSVTHSVNMDQRYIEPAFTPSSGTLFVQLPANPAEVPPGYYLLFAFDSRGVPSVGRMVRVNIPTNPVAVVDYTPMIGRLGAVNFQLSCNVDETAVGMYGHSAGTYVNRVGLQCVRVDATGKWIDDPVNRGAAGTATGEAYERTCPRDSAISGFRGRAGDFVDQLEIECRPLTSAGTIAGAGQFLPPVGGSGGSSYGPFSCSTGNPVHKLVGWSGGWLDVFGMECRRAPITGAGGNTAPALTNPGNQASGVGDTVELQVVASDPDADTLVYSASGLPLGLAIGSNSGLIAGSPTTAATSAVTVNVSDGADTSSVSFTWTISALDPLVLDPMPKQPAREFGVPVEYTANARNGINPRYKWYFDDGSETAWSASATVSHTFAKPGIFWVSVTATDDRGIQQTQTFSQLVHLPLTERAPAASGGLAIENGRLWVVNPDNDSVSVISTASNARLAEIPVGSAPRALAVAPGGRIWVTNRGSSSISVVDPSTLAVTAAISLPYASRPYGIAFAPDGSAAFVALEGLGRVLKLNAATGSQLAVRDVGANPRHVSVNAAGSRVYVSRFITPPLPGEGTAVVSTEVSGSKKGGEIVVLDAATFATVKTIVLQHSDDMDFENSGSGIPNYLGPAVISPDGRSAWVPSKQDNVKRGTLRSGANLNFQNTVRAVSSRIDLATEAEHYGSRIDHDNASLVSAATFERYGVFLLVALETSREVAIVDAHSATEFFRIPVGRAPQGIAVSPAGDRLYVSNFMDRTIGVYDLSKLVEEGQWQAPHLATVPTVGAERLAADVLKGKQLFYDALDTRLSRDRYMSCATCHNDGGHDGRVWDLTGFAEGLRNTISLSGRAGGHGLLHWSGNFDEVQDFEGQIRALAGGTGLMSDSAFAVGTRSQPLGDPKAGLSADLDALAAYVASLKDFGRSPFRNANGTLTSTGVSGRDLFNKQNCAQCHGGADFTSSATVGLKNIGTIKPSSGKRLGGTLTGIDPPTLRGVWATAPYLHDGSAATLEDAVRAHSGVSLRGGDLSKLTAYLRQIDALEPGPSGGTSPSPNSPPVVVNPLAQSGKVNVAVSLQIEASDPDGDTLGFSASGLPSGLSIGAATGRITGIPKKTGTWSSTVTVSDGKGGSAAVTFSWTITR